MDFEAREVGRIRVRQEDYLRIADQHVVDYDFAGRRLLQFAATGSRFERCRFDDAVIDGATFGSGRTPSEYVNCSFDGARLRMGPGGYARFVDCSFEKTFIENWFCFAVELVGCTFSGKLKKVFFNGTVPTDKRDDVGRMTNQFEENDFSGAKFYDVGFRTGIDLRLQRLPSSPDYTYLEDAASALGRARAALDTWEDLEAKKHAQSVLTVLEEDVAAGQHQLLIRVDDYPLASRPAIRHLLDAASSS
jgi:hypothetical protein